MAIVAVGTFNPAIVHPSWLCEKGLITQELADWATEISPGKQEFLISPQITYFRADWLVVQVRLDRFEVSSVESARFDELRDLSRGIMEVLPETPVSGLGINSNSHYRTESESTWHAVGDRFAPKADWHSVFDGGEWRSKRDDGEVVGMQTLIVQLERDSDDHPGRLSLTIQPSAVVTPNGVFFGINSHFDVPTGGAARAGSFARLVADVWQGTTAYHSEVSRNLEALL